MSSLLRGVGWLVAAGILGCANPNNPPFHVYHSPLLHDIETEAQPPRSYDPFGEGVIETEIYVASDSQNTAGASVPSVQKKTEFSRTNLAVGSSSVTPERPKSHHSASEEEQTPELASEYVWSIYQLNGVTMDVAAKRQVSKIFRQCKDQGRVYNASRPAVGDIAFFHNTRDANGDGRNNDWYTHVAIVDEVRTGGTVELLSFGVEKVSRAFLNLETPDDASEETNTRLRSPANDDAPFTQYYAGQLFAGFCSLLDDKKDFISVDNWQPGMILELPNER
jgi:hypothetical protein